MTRRHGKKKSSQAEMAKLLPPSVIRQSCYYFNKFDLDDDLYSID